MAQAVCFGFRVGEIPVPTRYFAEASSVNFERSVEYGLDVLKLMLRYALHRAHIWRSRQFTARLEDILAPRHREAILRRHRAHGERVGVRAAAPATAASPRPASVRRRVAAANDRRRPTSARTAARVALVAIVALAAVVRLWGLGGAAGAVLRLGRVPRRRRVSGQRGPARGVGAGQPGPDRPARSASRSPPRTAPTPTRPTSPSLATPSCWPSRCCCSARRRWPARSFRRWPASAPSRLTYALGHARLGTARRDPRGRAAGDLGPAPGLFARAAGRSRRAVLRHRWRRWSICARAAARAARGGRAVGRRVRLQQPPVVPAGRVLRSPSWRAGPALRGFVRRGVRRRRGCPGAAGGDRRRPTWWRAASVAPPARAPTSWTTPSNWSAFTRMNPPDRVRFDEWPTYFVDLALMDGLGVLALLLVGIGVLRLASAASAAVARRPAAGRLAAGAAGAVQRVLDRRGPPAALLAGHAVGHAGGRRIGLRVAGRRSRADATTRGRSLARVGGAGAAGRARGSWRSTRRRRACRRCSAPSAGPVAGTNGPVLAFYVGEERTNARLREAFVNVPADLPPLAATYPTAGRRHAGRRSFPAS